MGEIVGDVWLFNRCQAPAEPQWRERSLIPLALSRGYLAEGGVILASVHGVLGVGDKPGYAWLVAKSSPLANEVLERLRRFT